MDTRALALANADHFAAPPSTPVPAPVATPAPVIVAAQQASTPVPVAAPVARRAVTPVPAVSPEVLHNFLTSGDGTLRTGVGVYGDCTGRTPLTRAEAAIDPCSGGPTYFVGHNAGVFTPLMHMAVGAIIVYHDGAGVAHSWRVVSVRDGYASAGGVPAPTQADVVAQFQTCETYSPSGQFDRILDVVEA
ncbi:MAG TPA: hypothetical protein VGL20_19890 [Candidatus Dormibacteraeota bacterium]